MENAQLGRTLVNQQFFLLRKNRQFCGRWGARIMESGFCENEARIAPWSTPHEIPPMTAYNSDFDTDGFCIVPGAIDPSLIHLANQQANAF